MMFSCTLLIDRALDLKTWTHGVSIRGFAYLVADPKNLVADSHYVVVDSWSLIRGG